MPKIAKNRFQFIPDISELLPEREYRCEFNCGRLFKNRTPYEVHLQKKHGVDIKADSDRSFCCPAEDCVYSGARLDLLRRHFQTYHMDKRFKCRACNRSFLTEPQFLRHKCELGIYTCHNCPMAFNFVNHRNRHVKRCERKPTLPVPSPSIIEQESVDQVVEMVDSVEPETNDELTIDEFEQLLKNIDNNVVRDPALIEELAALTPLLQSLQS